ncbi:MAG TPA: Fic family protein [Candidatus Coprenecus pullicola]|nr:Fic family protein [Candidatus Coprenecus pullicola]
MRPIYIWQYPEWPSFTWNDSRLIALLSEVRNLEGKIQGMMDGLGFNVQSMTALNVMTEDVLRSNEIEGVILNSDKVRSSIARHLGIDTAGLPQPDHYTEGVVQIMMDAVTNCNKPLTPERLFNWHAALFPTGRSGMYPITVGAYRTGGEPMQIVSGAMGKEKVHYEAPPSDVVPDMMTDFLTWINSDNTVIDPVLKAAVAHLWFVAIHPFDDGNGRLTRTITDMQLAKADGFPLRFYSVSAEILREKKAYYEILEHTTSNSTDITEWLEWFLNTMKSSILRAKETVKRVVCKSSFWQRHREIPMNERQVRVVNMLWDGFTGKLTSSKWAKITKTSQATALRDITDLIEKGILTAAADGGRSSNYLLKDDADQYGGKEC